MEIWLIKDGEKAGPFQDYDIRRKIGTGELSADSPAWHEGMAEWSRLSEITAFRNAFQTEGPAPVVREAPSHRPGKMPPSLPEPPRLMRRFWARWFDLSAYLAIWWLVLWATGRDIGSILRNPWVILPQFAPWMILEIILIHYAATTPGKWLLGLRVVNADGTRLDLMQSTRRAFGVYVLGIGLGWEIVSVFCMGLSALTTKRLGATMWDHFPKHRVRSSPLRVWGILAVIFGIYIAVSLQWAVQGPHIMKAIAKERPELREYIEKNPGFTLPPRHE